MITLFIGGAHDGARIDIDETQPAIRLPVIESLAMGTITIETPKEAIFETEHYIRHTFRTTEQDFWVFALSNMHAADIMRLLLVRYPKPVKK